MKKPIINPGIIKRLKSIFAIVQDGDVATRNIASGKYVLWKNVPCHASSAITTGDTLAIGTNLTADNDGFINALHDGLGAFSGKAIANNLTTETAGYVLDARQGKELSDSVTSLNDSIVPILNIKQLWYAYDNAPCLFVQTTDDHIFKVQLTQVS